jgi:large subunit ribosomal protein L24
MHVKTKDTVEVIAGNDRGQRGVVLKVDRAKGKVVVEGINRCLKHVRRSQRNPQGGRLSKEMPIDLSNVLLVCPACGRAGRSGARILQDGAKERYCKKCGAKTGDIAPPRVRRNPAGAGK